MTPLYPVLKPQELMAILEKMGFVAEIFPPFSCGRL